MTGKFLEVPLLVEVFRGIVKAIEEELATDAIAELDGAVEELNQVLALLENGGKT